MHYNEDIFDRIEPFLVRVAKPARYVGGELNVIRKDPEQQNIRVCLAFPDVYDIGQSYIGFDILYHILNRRPGTLCERTFAPWPDMEDVMRREGIPLWSLENFLPVGGFDVVGFTLQYELHYTTILDMLDLAGIPLRSADRGDEHPFVFGGGPCAVNPEPVAPFLDAVLLGDGEEAFPVMLNVVERGRSDGRGRADILRDLAGVRGVYVPSMYMPRYGGDGVFAGMDAADGAPVPVRSRFVEELRSGYYPDRPLVPICEVVHDRLAVELERGCTRGCRFCNAGMAYRPRRSRPVGEVLDQVVKGITSTGWNDISLVSLSTTDYPGLDRLVTGIGHALADRSVSISLSSMRADNFALKMAEAVAGGRKSSLTFAPEAGTQRLRDVINKNLTEEQLFETLETALAGGWTGFKLYFMIGLPTETDDDVTAIADVLNRVNILLRRHKGRRVNVTVSPFSPKPQTPFQREAQVSSGEIRRRLGLLRDALKAKLVHLKLDDPLVSMLECRLGRGGRELAPVVEDAWRRGCRLDGWSEHFDGELWRGAFAAAGIDLDAGSPALDDDAVLPWGHLHFGLDSGFLAEERRRAYAAETTGDCGERCHQCGDYAPFCAAARGNAVEGRAAAPAPPRQAAGRDTLYGRRKKAVQNRQAVAHLPGTRFRVKYAKRGVVRYIGHLDIVRLFDRVMRRAGIPIAYSQGFHPHPKIAFGPPLPLGMSSLAEYIDLSLSKPFPGIEAALRSGLVEGCELVAVRAIPDRTDSLNQVVSRAEYHVACDYGMVSDAVDDLMSRGSIEIERITKKGPRVTDIRAGIVSIGPATDGSGMVMMLSLEQGTMVKPQEVLDVLYGGADIPRDITRVEQYARFGGQLVTPMDISR